MSLFTTLIRCALAFLIPAAAFAQHFPPSEALTELIRSRVEEGGSVGIVLGVMEADGATRIVSYGSAGEGAAAIGEETVFEIGSITKVFTGILLADMTMRGEVSLSDPVSRYLPEGVSVPSRGRGISLLDLATHRSGLPRLPGNLAPADAANPYADYTVEQMYAFLSSYELPRDVGAGYEYSNLGMGLLGHALARRAGAGYGDLVHERILAPLGMRMTGIALDGEMRRWMAVGHDGRGEPVPLWDLPAFAGAGALRSNALDMLAFLRANIGPPASALERAMRVSHEARADAGTDMRIGLGWHILAGHERRIVWHNGGTGGFRTLIAFDPDARIGVVVLANSTHGIDDVGFHLLDPSLPLAPPSRPRSEIAVAEAVLQTYVGEYRLAPAFSIEVTIEDGTLYVQATGQDRFPVFAESETEFFLKVVDAQITFDRDGKGVVTGLTLHQAGQHVPGHKVR